MPNFFDVAVIGAGPAGSACAVLCAEAGWRVLILEKSQFPREKVCGDCLNPACWPVLEELGVSGQVRAQTHSQLASLDFISPGGRSLQVSLPPARRGEVAVKRSLLDAVLLDRAREAGVEVHENSPLTTVTRGEAGWKITSCERRFSARLLVAADGRNSTVARLLGLLPALAQDRVGLQTHLPAPPDFGERVVMHFLPLGYCGSASVGGGELNVCLVSRARHLGEMKRWAAAHFALREDHAWRTITPLARAAVSPAHERLLLVGDAARVVEPFTGEGIYYALATGALAARHIIAGDLAGYAKAHARIYRGRLWVNQLAKAAVLHPRLATAVLGIARLWPSVLHFLTAKVVGKSDRV